MRATVDLLGETFNLELDAHSYVDGGRVAITAVCDDGERFGTVTVNEPGADLGPGEVLVKTWTENVWVRQLLELLPGHFRDTGRRVSCGHSRAEVWEFNQEGGLR
jgi:hypothetical protein